jgi:hypothetical protein
MTIVLSPKLARQHADYVERLLQQFVCGYKQLYGEDMVVYNVHSLLHIPQKKVKRPYDPLPQIVRRVYEHQKLSKPLKKQSTVLGMKKPHCTGPLPEGVHCFEQYKCLDDDRFRVSCSSGDNCFVLGSQIILVENIVRHVGQDFVVYRYFLQKTNFFEAPLNSSTLGIYVVTSLSPSSSMCLISQLSSKCFLMPHPNDLVGTYVCMPLAHCFV